MSPKQTQAVQADSAAADAAKEAEAELAAELAAKQAEADAAEEAKRAEDELAADRARAEAEAAEAKAAAEAADAKAEADRQAQAAAQAEAETLAPLNLSRLSYLERQITLLNSEGTRQGLIDELVQVYDMTGSVGDGDRVVLSMQGITIDPAEGMKNALDNWGSAARRAIAGIAAKAGKAEVAE